jgi:hypothetical protein
MVIKVAVLVMTHKCILLLFVNKFYFKVQRLLYYMFTVLNTERFIFSAQCICAMYDGHKKARLLPLADLNE